MGRTPALIALAVVAGCGSSTHAPVDAGPDARHPDSAIDADLVDYAVTGTYLDWDSTVASPCGIAGATLAAHYDNTRVGTTDDTGMFTIRIADYLWWLDVQQPAAASPCASVPGTYSVSVIAIFPPAVYYAGGHIALRAPTDARASQLALAPTLAALFVHVDGPARAVSISSSSDAAQAFDGTSWALGAIGTDVFFPNIDPGTAMATTVSVAGGAVGTGSIQLAAGSITYMTVIPK